uniref:Zinc finger MYM-type protein 1 n=1 Tax=Sipha flava TaxID=143950 RepID=A0A2S2Q3Q9_9HEMI
MSTEFPLYEKSFPQTYVDETIEAYPFLNKRKLQTELELIYKRTDFRSVIGAVNLLQFIIDNNLEQIFSETFKLIRIIATIPMTSAEAERSFSTLKRIKTFLRNSMAEERLTALAMLSIEKKIVNQISNFNEEVIKVFMKKKDRRIDLEFKNITTV